MFESLSPIYDKSILYGTKGATQRDKNHEDLDHKINTLHAQSEAEMKKALLDLIVDIIVKTTLKEYYETNDCLENEQE